MNIHCNFNTKPDSFNISQHVCGCHFKNSITNEFTTTINGSTNWIHIAGSPRFSYIRIIVSFVFIISAVCKSWDVNMRSMESRAVFGNEFLFIHQKKHWQQIFKFEICFAFVLRKLTRFGISSAFCNFYNDFLDLLLSRNITLMISNCTLRYLFNQWLLNTLIQISQ